MNPHACTGTIRSGEELGYNATMGTTPGDVCYNPMCGPQQPTKVIMMDESHANLWPPIARVAFARMTSGLGGFIGATLLAVLFVLSLTTIGQTDEGLQIQKVGTNEAYFAHRGRPLLSFGGLSDFIFYANDDAYHYKRWVDWAAAHGMNHLRAYPPLSWKHQEAFARLNGGDKSNVLFPYEETPEGSRQFDLTKFNQSYWHRIREQLKYLSDHGIIVHLLMWNGWQLRTEQSHSSPTAQFDWSGHFFNPENNVNHFTDHLGGRDANRFDIYHSVADDNAKLIAAQEAWFEKLATVTAEFDNVYFDLIHELAEHHGNWEKTQRWIEHMAMATRERFESRSGRSCILGMDTGGLSADQRHWIYTRPFFDILIHGKKHTVGDAWSWRNEYQKPYVPQESWDDDGTKYRLIYKDDRVHIRKYMWKFMLAKCQQLDLYIKPLRKKNDDKWTAWPHNYDPRGWNDFEIDAPVLRAFWRRIADFPNLDREGRIEHAVGTHQYLLASDREAIAYLSSATGRSGVVFPRSELRLRDLPLVPGGDYRLDIVDPDGRIGVIATRLCRVSSGGRLNISLPEFTDDIVVHISASQRRGEDPPLIQFDKLTLTDRYYADGITAGDINSDGNLDVIAGPFWYEGPSFRRRHEFYKAVPLPPAVSPSNSMFSFVHDFSGDGQLDILVLGRVHKHPAVWYENPGESNELWNGHFAFHRVRGESPTLVDLDGNGIPQVICHWEGRWGSIEPMPASPSEPWHFKPVGADEGWPQFYHGQGVGDVNRDGRLDFIINDGWYEQPAAGDAMKWPFYRSPFSQQRGGAQMFVDDVDGDGDSDVISAIDAHGWGLAWYEQKRIESGVRFRERLIMYDRDMETEFGAAFSQPHALDLADIDGDGLNDIVVGKRMWAHGPKGDIEPNADPVLYWFQLTRPEDGVAKYVPHLIDDRSGVGVQVTAADVNGDNRVDILTASKLGAFVFFNRGSGLESPARHP